MYSLRWLSVRSDHSLRLMAVSSVHSPCGFFANQSFTLDKLSWASLSTISGGYEAAVENPAKRANVAQTVVVIMVVDI